MYNDTVGYRRRRCSLEVENDMMMNIPPTVEPYRTIGPFHQDSLPMGLLKNHNTKAGVWGLLEVIEGDIKYVITEVGNECEYLLSKTIPGVIVPEQKHHLELVGDVVFTITFFRAPK